MSDLFDRAVSTTRERLRAEAAQYVDSNATLRDIVNGHPRVQPVASGGDSRSRARWIMSAAALLVVVVGGLLLLRRDNGRPSSVPPGSTQEPAVVGPTTAITTVDQTTAGSTNSSLVVGPAVSYAVDDMSFADSQHGWAIVRPDTNSTLTILLSTTDGGQTWSAADVNIVEQSRVTFADAANGWIYGSNDVLQATHDGGVTWRQVDLGGAGLLPGAVALTSDGQTVSIIAGRTTTDQNVNWAVATSPIDRDDFTSTGIELQQGAGPANDWSLITSAGYTWVVYNDRVVAGAARQLNGAWSAWSPSWSNLGGAAQLAAAKDGGPLYALVRAGEYTGELQFELYRSDDLGETFQQVTLPTATSAIITPQQVLAIDSSTLIAILSQPDGSTNLYRSRDGGETWELLSTLNAVGTPLIHFADATTAFASQSTDDGTGSLVAKSVDGGATWESISVRKRVR